MSTHKRIDGEVSVRDCPFCDVTQDKLRIMGSSVYHDYSVVCTNCDTIGPQGISEEDATRMWNNRVK